MASEANGAAAESVIAELVMLVTVLAVALIVVLVVLVATVEVIRVLEADVVVVEASEVATASVTSVTVALVMGAVETGVLVAKLSNSNSVRSVEIRNEPPSEDLLEGSGCHKGENRR